MDSRPPTGFSFHRARELWSRRKWLAMLVFIGVFAPILTVAKSVPDIYRATATILVEHQQVAESFVRPAEGSRSFWTNELDTRLHTISQEILSRARLGELITRFDLYPKLRRVSLEAAIVRMRPDIKLDRQAVGETGVWGATVAFTLSYRGTDPRTVAEVTNALASSYVEKNLTIREGQATSTTQFLRAQLDPAKARLDEHERRIREFKQRHGSELPERFSANLSILERLNAMVRVNSENQLRALERRAVLARDLVDMESSRGGAETPAARLVRLKLELIELRQRFTDQYPEVMRVKAELAALERALAEADPNGLPVPTPLRLKQMLSELDAESKTLKGEEERLRREIAAYQRGLEYAPEREQQFQALTRDYEAARDLHTSLSKRHEDALLAERMEQRKGAQFRILDQAVPAQRPAAPNRQLLILYGLMLSLVMAGAVVMLAERLDTSLHTVDDLRARTGGAVLVSIPEIITGPDARRHRQRVALAAISVTLGLALIVGASAHFAHGNEQLAWMLARGR